MSIKQNNNIMIILGIVCIITLILLFRKHKQQILLSCNIIDGTVTKPNKMVRINPIPIFSPMMGPNEKFYENVVNEINAKSKDNILVLLCYANWCTNCKELKPIFKQLIIDQPLPNITFNMIEEKEKNEYSKYLKNLEGYPTIKIIEKNKITEYRGPRERQSIINTLKSYK